MLTHLLCAHAVQAAIMDINAAVRPDADVAADRAGVLRALKSQYAHFESVQDSNAPHYAALLKAARAAKAEVKGEGIWMGGTWVSWIKLIVSVEWGTFFVYMYMQVVTGIQWESLVHIYMYLVVTG